MKYSAVIITYFVVFICSLCQAKTVHSKSNRKGPIVVAVIDTGFGFLNRGHDAKLCKYGHKDFSGKNEYSGEFNTKDKIPVDNFGHGTNVTGIIDRYAKLGDGNYCLVILKYWDTPSFKRSAPFKSSVNAIKYATNIHADFINYSGGGTGYGKEEASAVKEFLDMGGKFITAAGNENSNIDMSGHHYYPAMVDKRNIVVGNISLSGRISCSSNFGTSVNRWEVGENVEAYGITLTGTSQATAVATGKIVSQINNH